MYDNYVFDFYGTLADISTDENNRGLWIAMSRYYGSFGCRYGWKELREKFRRTEAEETRRMQRDTAASLREAVLVEPDLTGVFQSLFQEQGVSCNRQMARQTAGFFRILSRRSIRLYDGVTETLRELRLRGKKLYVLSNAQSDFTRPELELLGLADCFDGILISSEEGCKKPCAAFFDRLLSRYGLDPARSLMIGNDEYADISGAVCAGMDSLYIHTAISSPPQGKYEPTYCVMDGNWEKVARILLETG